MEEDINDVIEEENDDKVNVADDNEIKHEASLQCCNESFFWTNPNLESYS